MSQFMQLTARLSFTGSQRMTREQLLKFNKWKSTYGLDRQKQQPSCCFINPCVLKSKTNRCCLRYWRQLHPKITCKCCTLYRWFPAHLIVQCCFSVSTCSNHFWDTYSDCCSKFKSPTCFFMWISTL